MLINPSSPDPFNPKEVQYINRRYALLRDTVRHKARAKHLHFCHYTWNNPSEPFAIGLHTRIICDQIDQALDEYAKGRSVFKIITVPFRHGKAFQIDTPILTVVGWKKHGQLKAGDYVFNQYGEAVRVEAVTPIYSHSQRIIKFGHGEFLYTTPEHEWIINYHCKKKGWMPAQTLETKQIKFRGMGLQYDNQTPYILCGKEVLSLRYKQCPDGFNHDMTEVKSVKLVNQRHNVNCIQVEGGVYLVGKGLIPTHNSELVSRRLPARFLGLFPDGKVLMTGHTATLSVNYSKDSRNLLSTDRYQELFPDTKVSPYDGSAGHWRVWKRNGEVFASGLGGAMAGQGYSLGIVDDYCRNRQDAESPTMRERMWSSLTNDFLTRRAPKSITIITATPWHVDDIIGRIKAKMAEDPFFPKFEIICLPAFSDEYPQGILFPERFNHKWYDEQRAALGDYGTASLLQCNPTQKGGNIFKIGNVKKVKLTEFPDIPYIRVYDLAHTLAERTSPDPDYTSGTLLAMRRKPGAPRQWELWVKDVIRFRLDAPQRDNRILNQTEIDGSFVKVGIESSLDSKDAFKHLQNLLLGRRIVEAIKGKGDKMVRAQGLEPIFEAGDVYVPEGASWYNNWIDELATFPSGKHDDQVDNLSAGFAYFVKSPGTISVPLYGR